MLNTEQRTTKWESIAETIEYTNNKNDKKYREFVAKGNLSALKQMVDAAAKAAGYITKSFHQTNAQHRGTSIRNDRVDSTAGRRGKAEGN